MDKTDVTYDDDDQGWVARRGGEELGRNHRIGKGEGSDAVKWAAWLAGEPVPLDQVTLDCLSELSDEPGLLCGLSAREMLQVLAQNKPGHRTDEFAMQEIGGLWAAVCTSLDDQAATERARSCPSGTSGGWALAEATWQTCTDWPATHRHVMFEAV